MGCEELAAKFRADVEKHMADGHREPNTYIGVSGHAGFLNAVAHAIATASGMEPDSLDRLLDIELGEAEGILVPLYGKGKSATTSSARCKMCSGARGRERGTVVLSVWRGSLSVWSTCVV